MTGAPGIRVAAFDVTADRGPEQWSAEEIRSEQIVQKLDTVNTHATTAMKGVFLFATAPFWLAILLIPLTFIAAPLILMFAR